MHELLLNVESGRKSKASTCDGRPWTRPRRILFTTPRRRRAASVAERHHLARGVEAERASLADDLEVGALLDLGEKSLGALQLPDHERVLNANDAGVLRLGQPDAAQRALHRLAVGVEDEGQL